MFNNNFHMNTRSKSVRNITKNCIFPYILSIFFIIIFINPFKDAWILFPINHIQGAITKIDVFEEEIEKNYGKPYYRDVVYLEYEFILNGYKYVNQRNSNYYSMDFDSDTVLPVSVDVVYSALNAEWNDIEGGRYMSSIGRIVGLFLLIYTTWYFYRKYRILFKDEN